MSSKLINTDTNAGKFIELVVKRNKVGEIVLSACKGWLIVRNNTIGNLKSLAHDIDKHHKNVNIATLSATYVGALGGVAIIGGLLLAPVTGGISAILATGGSFANIFGGVAAIGSVLVEMGITKKRCKITQAQLKLDNVCTKILIKKRAQCVELSDKLHLLMTCFTDTDLMETAEKIKNMTKIESLQKVYLLVVKTLEFFGFNVSNMKTSGFQMIQELKLSKLADLSKNETFSSKGLFIKPAKLSGKVKFAIGSFTTIFLVVDIWSIVTTSIDIRHGSKSETGNKVREILVKFEDERDDINDIIQLLIN